MKKIVKKIYIFAILVATTYISQFTIAEAAENMSLVNQINEIRAEAGVCELKVDAKLEKAAAIRAKEASVNWSHVRPDGTAWYTVDRRIMGGENLAKGQESQDQLVEEWMNSPSHADNILFADFRTTGIGVYVAEDGTVYTCQAFGY